MNENELQKVKELCQKHPEIKLGYFFGSRATGTSGPMSDYDFAFYLENAHHAKEIFLFKAEIQSDLTLILKTDNVDVVILNTLQNPALGYNIISMGKLIYEVEPYKLLLEPRILNQYFDFKIGIEKNYLMKAKK